MRRLMLLVSLSLLAAAPAFAHVTPNVQLVGRGSFIQSALPGATRFFESHLELDPAGRAALRESTGWTPTADDTKVYVGRTGSGELVGRAVFVWTPSQHGPVSIGVAFDPDGRVLAATVTDVGSEPLAWVQPLLDAGGMLIFTGLRPGARVDPDSVAAGVHGAMSRYYAGVIAGGVERAQAVERVVAAR